MSLTITSSSASTTRPTSAPTTAKLSTSLTTLSSAMKINSGDNGPAAFVISEQQRALVTGLQTTIDNTNTAVATVQTANSVANQVDTLLKQIRDLAVDSSAPVATDSNVLAANQAQVSNTLATIANLPQYPHFDGKPIVQAPLPTNSVFKVTTGQALAAYAEH